MKKFLFFFLLNIAFFHQVEAKDSLAVDLKLDKDWCASVTSDIANWIEGYQMGSDVLSVYLNVTTYEFQDFLDLNTTDQITLRLFWRSNSGNQIRREVDYIIDSTEPDFDIRNWTAIHEPADLEGGYYVVQVLIGDNTCSEFIPIIMVEEIDEEEQLPIDLPSYNCGDDYEYKTPEGNTDLSSAAPGDIFFIGGFPILLETVTPPEGGDNGMFSGTGVIPLPFDRKVVSVEFFDVHVNDKREITSGDVIAQGDDPENYPNFNPDTDIVNIGGEICLPPAETPGYENGGVDENGLNPRGFDPTTAVHSETGTNFDPNGFDMNGNYQDGTPYNQCGCSIEGLTEANEPCDITCGPNPEAEEFAENIASNLPTEITTIINLLIAENQTLLTSLGCPQIRGEIEDLNNGPEGLGYDPVFVFGEGNKYINDDMHLHFTERPQPLPINISTRDPKAVLLEKKHIDLYDCDKQAYALRAYIQTLNFLNEQAQKDPFVTATLTKIENWSEYMLNLMKGEADDQPGESEEFQNWLAGEIGQYMMDHSGLDHSYHNLFVDNAVQQEDLLQNKIESIFDFNQRGTYHDIASIEPNMAFDEAFTLEDASFLFRQGHQKINGVDRAYYLEELAKKQSLVVSENAPQLMPIIVDKTVSNKTYTIYLDQIVFSTTGARVNAFLIITDPESGKRIIFKGLNIGFGPTGLQGESRLSLESEVQIRLNNSAMFILNPSGETFVEWDCEGFSRMGVDAGIEFCRNFITPLDPGTLEPVADEEARYRFNIITEIDSWLEFNLTLDGGTPFAVTKYEDIKWQFSDVILDFSSSSTADFEPPEGFASPYYDGVRMDDLWKGVFIDTLSVRFPNNFSSGSEPIMASATNVLIDGNGFSGGLSVTNLITIDDGNLGGWPFSINNFHLKILNNQYAGAGMGGEVNVPIFEENLVYRAAIYPDNEYHFSITTQSDLTADVFVASVTLEENSAIDVSYVEGEFTAVATLHGNMEINTGANDNAAFSVGLPTVTFQGLEISNKPTHFNAGTWGIESAEPGAALAGISFNGFGLKLMGIEPLGGNHLGQDEAGLKLDLEVSFSDDDKISFAGRGVSRIIGKMETNATTHRQSWDFDRIELERLNVKGQCPGVKRLDGEVFWYDDNPDTPTGFGEGFRGSLFLELEKTGIGVDAVAQFGKVDGVNGEYKYFFVDAMVKLGNASPTIGVMKFTGFGGGVSNNMNLTQTHTDLANAPENGANIPLPALGQSLSGTLYTPNENASLGLKAVVTMATLQENIFNGTAGMSFEFFDGGGINQISFFGSGHFLKGVDLGIQPGVTDGDDIPNGTRPAVVAPLSAYIDLNINFANQANNQKFSLDGSLVAYLNAGILVGAAGDGKMIDARVHFSDKEWFIYIGTPDEPANINLNLPFIQAGVTAYLDIGTNVPPMPDLPDNVKEIAYKVNDNSSLRQSGGGFVFGAAITVGIQVGSGSLVSGSVEAGAGFDISLRKYNNLRCLQSNGELGDVVGIDGWYATGQIWAFVQGEVRVFGAPILRAGIAAVLQARLPNPFFAQATVGVRVKIGPVKFNKSLSLKLGNDCTLVSNDPNDAIGIDIIPYIDPTNGGESIETNAKITAPYNVKPHPLTYVEVTTLDGEIKRYNVEVIRHEITTDQGIELDHFYEIDYNNNQIVLEPKSFFPGETTITAIIDVAVKEGGDVIGVQSDTTIFVTAPDMEIIPETNVEYVYPANGMNNFYPAENVGSQELGISEYSGYLKMRALQPAINNMLEEDTYIRFTDNEDNETLVPVSYNYLENRIDFVMGTDLLENDKGYKMELVHYTHHETIPLSAVHIEPTAGTRPLNSSSLLVRALGGSSPIVSPSAAGTTEPVVISTSEQIIYTNYFRVSKYNTFTEKMEDVLTHTGNWFSRNIGNEAFDEIELKGRAARGLRQLIWIAPGTNNPQLNLAGSFYTDITGYTPLNVPPGCPERIDYNDVVWNQGGPEATALINDFDNPLELYSQEAFLNNLPAVVPLQQFQYSKDKLILDMSAVQSQLRACELTFPPIGGGLLLGPNDSFCSDYPFGSMCSAYGENVVQWLFHNALEYEATEGTYPVHLYYKLPHQNNSSSFNTQVTYDFIFQDTGTGGTGQ